ncbi:hypothetical protein WJX79_008986 [Trebouxia sp. C0005]
MMTVERLVSPKAAPSHKNYAWHQIVNGDGRAGSNLCVAPLTGAMAQRLKEGLDAITFIPEAGRVARAALNVTLGQPTNFQPGCVWTLEMPYRLQLRKLKRHIAWLLLSSEQEEAQNQHLLFERMRQKAQKSVAKEKAVSSQLRQELYDARQKVSQAVSALRKELHETRATCVEAQQAAQLKITELEASSQLTRDLQEQLSHLATEKAANEQRLQAKTEKVVSLHDKAMAAEQRSHDLKTQNSRLKQQVDHLKESLADVLQLNSKMSQESELKSAQQAQQNAELAAVKQEFATRLAAFQELAQAAKIRAWQNGKVKGVISDKWVVLSAFGDLQAARDRSDQLQQQLAQRGTDLHAVQEELDKLQKDYSDKCDEESELKSAQQAQQDAELAAAKQEFATRLAGHQELAQVATDRANELQERLDRAFVHQDDAKEQISERQMELAGKRNKVTNAKLAIPALTHRASVQEAQKHSAQLQKQLDQKVTEVESLQQKLTSLDAELGRMAKAKEADEDMSAQLQQQLAQKDTHLSSAEQELAHLRQELSQAQQSKHEAIRDEMEQMGSLKSQPRAPLADRDDAMQELTKRRKQGRAGACPHKPGFFRLGFCHLW